MTTQFKNFQILGITRDFNVCDCCGKEELTKTVAILDLTYGTVSHFGTTCAVSIDKYDTLEAAQLAKKDIQKEVRKFNELEKFAGIQAWKTLSKEARERGVKLDMESEVYKARHQEEKERIIKTNLEMYKNLEQQRKERQAA